MRQKKKANLMKIQSARIQAKSVHPWNRLRLSSKVNLQGYLQNRAWNPKKSFQMIIQTLVQFKTNGKSLLISPKNKKSRFDVSQSLKFPKKARPMEV
jgi:hypothetical protein